MNTLIISTTCIVLNELNEVLLIKRDDTRTLAPPGGSCELDELPTSTVQREVFEETGLIVKPTTLVGMYYLPSKPDAYLFLSFLCNQQGGEINASHETILVDFFGRNPLPRSMLALHREQVQNAFDHQVGPSYWKEINMPRKLKFGNAILNYLVYPYLHLRRRLSGDPPFTPPPRWKINIVVLIQNANEDILWTHSINEGRWLLPSTQLNQDEAPWAAATRCVIDFLDCAVILEDVSGIYTHSGVPQVTVVFVAKTEVIGSQPRSQVAFFSYKKLPPGALSNHLAFIKDAKTGEDGTVFNYIN